MNLTRALATALALFGVCSAADAAAPWVQIGGAEFLDLRVYSRMQDYRYSWDPVAKNAMLEGEGAELRFHVGSEYYLRNGRLEKMARKALFWNDSVVAALSGAAFLPEAGPPAVHRIRRIVLDAGHGGKDTGAISETGLQEKRVALEVARDVKQALEAAGVEVLMTRSADVFIPLAQRSHIANKNGADLFVSIHANASTSFRLDGFEVYTLSEATDDHALAVERAENSAVRFESTARAAASNGLKTILWDLKETQNRKESLAAAGHVLEQVALSVPVAAKRLRSANFYVLKWTECPALLIELAYVSNRADERKLRDPLYKARIADAVTRGVLAYKSEFETTDGYTR